MLRCAALLAIFALIGLLVGCDDDATDADPGADAAVAPPDGAVDAAGDPDAGLPQPDAAPLPDGPVARFALDPASDFWGLPFPEDARREPDGRVLLGRWPGVSEVPLVSLWMSAADELLTGFGLTSAFYLPFEGPLDPATLPELHRTDGSVRLVDVDPDSPELGRHFPLDCRSEADGGRWHPGNIVVCRTPFGLVRRALTRYAILVTRDLHGADGEPVRPSETTWRLLSGEDVGDRAAADHLAALEVAGLQRDEVSLVALFSTHDPTARLRRIAAWYDALPEPELDGPLSLLTTFPDYTVLQGRVLLPVIQQGERPYASQADSGRILFDEAGEPILVERQSVRFAVSLPLTPMPEGGFPVLLYMHGSGGDRDQFVTRGPAGVGDGPARVAAARGAAGYGFDFPLHGDRADPPDRTGLSLYNLLGNPRATVDNFIIAACEVTLHSRLLTALTVDPGIAPGRLDAGDAPDGLIRFAADAIVLSGQSMGSTIGVPAATIDKRVVGLILGGSGGTLVEVAVSSARPVPLARTLKTALGLQENEEVDRYDPTLNAVQHLWDLIDPVAHAPHLALRPHEGVPPKNLPHVHGLTDGYFSDRARAAVSIAAGADALAPVREPWLETMLALSGRVALETEEMADNREIGDLRRTVVATQFPPVPNSDGHNVTFYRDDAKAQWGCFLQSGGRRVRTPSAAVGPCP